MSAPEPAIRGAQAAQDAADAWRAVRADPTIQFAPLPLEPSSGAPVVTPGQPVPLPSLPTGNALPPVSPGGPAPHPIGPSPVAEAIRNLFEPIGKALGLAWPVMQWVLIALGAAIVLGGLYRLIVPWLERRAAARAAAPDAAEWVPERAAAHALLDDADALAAAGRYDEAAHLLLQRSVEQIAAARPDWVQPASTARDIARVAALPDRARAAFGVIAGRVERSLFALRRLDQSDWLAARAAYADFALAPVAADTAP